MERDVLNGHAGRGQLRLEPPLAPGRQEGDAGTTAPLQLCCEQREHPLRPAGTVGFDEVGDAHTGEAPQTAEHEAKGGNLHTSCPLPRCPILGRAQLSNSLTLRKSAFSGAPLARSQHRY